MVAAHRASTLSVSSFWAHPAALAAFLGGGCAWVADRTPGDGTGPGTLFHPGAIDVAGLVVMTLALAVARQAARQARAGAR